MTKDVLKEIFGKGDAPTQGVPSAPPSTVTAEPNEDGAALIAAELADPEDYRPYVIHRRGSMAFAVIEKNGTGHGFYWHEMSHPKHYFDPDGSEFLTFNARNFSVVMQGIGLRIVWGALLRGGLVEVREHDGRMPMRPMPQHQAGFRPLPPTRIDRLAVADVRDMTDELRALMA